SQLAAYSTANQRCGKLVGGCISDAGFTSLLGTGVVNPVGPNTEPVLGLMRATQIIGQANDNRASNYGGDIKLSNTAYQLPAGPVEVAFGLEGRRESLEQ